jgi:Putative prokaryotic signal transducing protein
MLKVLTTASSPVKQTLLLARLSDAGIPCIRGAGGARVALGSGHDILVEEEDMARAREVLKEDDEGFDEEELARLSEEAGRQAGALPQPAPEEPADPPAPAQARAPAKTHSLLKTIERLTGSEHEADSPFGR